MATELGHGVGLKSPRSPMGDFNLVRAAVKLNRRGEGFAKLFQPNVLAGDSEDDLVYEGTHDQLTQQFTRVSELERRADERDDLQQNNRALFDAQELKRGRHAGRDGGGQLFLRTQSAPDAISPASQAASGPSSGTAFRRRQTSYDGSSAGKDQLRPCQQEGKGKSLGKRKTGHGKSAHDRYREMALPWLANCDDDGNKITQTRKLSPKAGSDGDFTDSSDDTSPVQGVSQSVLPGTTEPSARPADDSSFVRARSAPQSGYIQDEFSRLPSNASILTYQSSDPADFEVVPSAQMQQISFTRSQSAPVPGQELLAHKEGEMPFSISRARSSGIEPDLQNTPRSARSSDWRLPRTPKGGEGKKPMQSAQEAAQELVNKGLRCDWTSKMAMPLCVAEQVAERLNSDAAFAESMPGEGPRGGVYTPKFVQTDFGNFLDRRDVMAINLTAEMEAPSASHILRYFTTNDGMTKLRKRGAVERVVQGHRAGADGLHPLVNEILDESYRSCREILLSGGISVLENIIYPADQVEESYDVCSGLTAGFCVFRHLHANFGKTLMYKHMKYRHYCGWIMVYRLDKNAKTTYKVVCQ